MTLRNRCISLAARPSRPWSCRTLPGPKTSSFAMSFPSTRRVTSWVRNILATGHIRVRIWRGWQGGGKGFSAHDRRPASCAAQCRREAVGLALAGHLAGPALGSRYCRPRPPGHAVLELLLQVARSSWSDGNPHTRSISSAPLDRLPAHPR